MVESLRNVDTKQLELTKWLLENPEFKEKPVPIKEFIEDSSYLNLKGKVFPRIQEILMEIFSGDIRNLYVKYDEVVFCAGIGSGKSFMSSIAISYMTYCVGCLHDPATYFGKAPGTNIYFMNMSVSEKSAKKVLFGEISSRINGSKWFRERFMYDKNVSSELRFPNLISIIPGNSSDTFFEGFNILGGVIDEADSHVKTDDKDMAEVGYDAIKSRIKSRFGSKGTIFIIGSPKTTDGFIMTRLKEAEGMTKTFAVRIPIWEAHPPSEYCGETFHFKKGLIELDIPIEYQDDFRRNPEKSLRDLAAIPSYSAEPFFAFPEKVTEGWNPDAYVPNKGNGIKRDFTCHDHIPRTLHIDLGLNKNGGDKCFHGDTEVLDENFVPKKIKDYEIGDRVLIGSSGNIGTVTRKTETIKSNMNSLRCLAHDIISTDNHKFLVLRKKDITYRSKTVMPNGLNKKTIHKKFQYDDMVQYVEAKNINIGDYLVVPKTFEIDSNYEIDWLLGMYLAEGDTYHRNNKNCVRFSLHINEDEYAEKIIKIIGDKFGKKAYKTKNHKHNTMIVRCHDIGDWFIKNGSKYCDKKFIKNVHNVGIGVVHGCIDGDGWINNDRHEVGLKTTSKKLAYQIMMLLTRYGFASKVYKENPDGKLTAYKVILRGKNADKYIGSGSSQSNGFSFHYGKYSFHRVTDNLQYTEPTKVYDLTILGDDSSYNVYGLAVHNCGVAMGHITGFRREGNEDLPNIKIDLMMEISAPPGGEIQISDIRQLIYVLISRGFKIFLVTMDGFQSVDSLQQFKKKGIRAELISVDRDLAPYEALKEAIYDGRLDYYYYEPFIDSAVKLELKDGKKVDHQPKGKKDVPDAVAGVVHNLITNKKAASGLKSWKTHLGRARETQPVGGNKWQ